ncbi:MULTISPECIES: acyl-CoA synthetase [unclassified Nocardioides]|uniref:acyl-CoA synthetase n=1 Tax=unclassified Nocardioides TaxID=2615069 RepID=UPI0006F8C169|nr:MULTISPECIES: acyl-CoA synthetase [unclassified Nocardioides]KQY56403.1 acyl-CoA synthetase [Nocardioides sp. Root140]KQZ75188.1 acyl-CoA synthetase [Nocardioides sp. Root151]KRF14266.1 acyl-CoA synthetase [Nocardioides sp. Soil796]
MAEALLPGLLRARTDRHLSVAGTTTSHADLLAAAAVVADSLAGRRRVAVLATPTMSTVLAVTGALLAGVEVVPVPPDSGAAELRHILSDATPDAWLGAAPDDTSLPALEIDETARASYTPVQVDPERIAFVLYTSGTTGLPKGVLLSRRALTAGLDGLIDAWAWTSDDVLVHGLPLFHVHGLVLGVLGPLRIGGSLVHVGRGTPEAYAGAKGTMYFAVPTIWSRLAESPDHARELTGARLLVSGSAALPVPVFERLKELTGHEVAERYGMSETLITVATRADGVRRAGWVGVPVAGVETRLRDEHGADVPHDGESVGRLEVRGATLFDGYLNRAEATAETFTDDGWFVTGDVAVIDADGAHRIVGRESVDLIKSAGYRIGAGEIESTLLGHPAVAECAVIGAPDPDLGQKIVAFVVARTPVSAADLTSYVGEELSAHKRPREIVFVDALPRNEMGKVQKKRL